MLNSMSIFSNRLRLQRGFLFGFLIVACVVSIRAV